MTRITTALKARSRRGIAIVWVALLGIVFVAFVGLASDAGHIYVVSHQLQNAADASSLAGALKVRQSAVLAHTAAITTAASNKAASASVVLSPNLANAANGDVVIGFFNESNQTFTATLTSPNAVKVTARRTAGSPGGPVPLIFGSLAGVQNSNVSRTAIAVIGGTIDAGIVLLKPTGTALSMKGNTSVVVNDGAVQINSTSSNSVSANGSTKVYSDALYLGGNGNPGSHYVGDHLGLNSPQVPDPLINLPEPSKGTTQSATGTTLNPGYYPSGISPKSGTIRLNPGIYYIEGGISTKADLVATGGVMLFIASGAVDFGSQGSLTINPPTSGTYKGISIYQKRGNTAGATIQAGAGAASTGTFYFPSASVSLGGHPQASASQVIAQSLDSHGTGDVIINYNGNFPVQGHDVWLAQ